MAKTRAELADAVGQLASRVEGSVQDASNVVEKVQNAFDLTAQVEKHPWPMVGVSVAAGFIASEFLNTAENTGRPSASASYASSATTSTAPAGHNGNGYTSAPRQKKPRPVWMQTIFNSFQDELTKLKGVAIGTTGGLVRDWLIQAAPEPLKPKITEIANELTTKLGGEVIADPMLPDVMPHHHNGRVHA